MNRYAWTLVGAGVALGGVATATAQDFPSHTIQIIVPYAAGGGTDLSARITADILPRHLPGATVVVANQGGGGGAIGTGAALNAEPNGYTLATGAQGPLSLLPHYGGTTYTIEDVEFIALMARNLQLVLACDGAPFSDFEEFVAYGRDNPGETMIGNSGAGGANHLAIEAFATAAGAEFENVPFAGAADALTACAGGHIDATIATPAEARPYVDSGALTPLFIMEEERIADFPDTPTAVEHGIDFTWSSWKGIVAPQGLPEAVRETLEAAFEATFSDPEFVTRMEALGEVVDYRDGAGYEQLARTDSEIAEEIIRELGMYGMNAPR